MANTCVSYFSTGNYYIHTYNSLITLYFNFIIIKQPPSVEIQFSHSEILLIETTVISDYTVNINKFNRTATVLNSNLGLQVPLSDDFSMEIEVFAMQGNEYRKFLPNINLDKLCSFLQNDKTAYGGVVEASNFPPQSPDMCPIPPKLYKIENYLLDLSNATFSIPNYIKMLKLINTFSNSDQKVLSVAVYIKIE